MIKLNEEIEISINKIPFGDYCYDKSGLCPYWSKIKSLPKQYNGYCSFLKKSDIDLSGETECTNLKTGEIVNGDDMPFGVSLLWDQVKSCNINEN